MGMGRTVVRLDVDLKPAPSSTSLRCYCGLGAALVASSCLQGYVPWEYRRCWISALHRRLGISEHEGIILYVYIRTRLLASAESFLDKAWEQRVNALLKLNLMLEHTMWRFSTLGGAMSSMGDFFDRFAERVMELSLRQRQIAFAIGDPVLVSRCNLYIGLALAQRKQYSAAFHIIRSEHRRGRKYGWELIMNCAKGLHIRIRQMQKLDGQ